MTNASFRTALLSIVALVALGSVAPAQAEPIIALTTTNALVTFDSATPSVPTSTVIVTGTVGGELLLGIDFRPATGQLLGLSSGSRLYSINPVTGAATQIGADGQFTLSGSAFGFDVNPTVDRVRVVSNADQNLRLNPNNGALAATDIALNYAVGDANFGANPNVVGAAYTNNFSGAVSTDLYYIDSGLDRLVTTTNPNGGLLNTVGALGVNTNDFVGFDISGLTGTAYASLTVPGGLSSLYLINLTSGSATLVGQIGAGAAQLAVVDIAAPVGSAAVPEPATLLLMSAGLAGVLRRRSRR
jgi:hypothetical protein